MRIKHRVRLGRNTTTSTYDVNGLTTVCQCQIDGEDQSLTHYVQSFQVRLGSMGYFERVERLLVSRTLSIRNPVDIIFHRETVYSLIRKVAWTVLINQ